MDSGLCAEKRHQGLKGIIFKNTTVGAYCFIFQNYPKELIDKQEILKI